MSDRRAGAWRGPSEPRSFGRCVPKFAPEWQAGPHVVRFVEHRIRMYHAKMSSLRSPRDRFLDRRNRRRPILCIHCQRQFGGTVRPRPVGPFDASRLSPRRSTPDTGSFPLAADSVKGHGHLQPPASAGMSEAKRLGSEVILARHLQADIHTTREEAVIILSLHLVHSRRLVEAADVGNPTRQLIGSRGLACTSHLIQILSSAQISRAARRLLGWSKEPPLAVCSQRTTLGVCNDPRPALLH